MQLSKSKKKFSLIFLIIIILELIFGSIESLSQFHYFIKPLILIALIIFFYLQSKHLNQKTRKFMFQALVFSLIGDILLMYVAKSSTFFIGGLLSFLLAHIMYILVFFGTRNKEAKPLPITIILLVYALGLFYFIKDGLAEMLIPVLLYLIVILAMVITAFLRKKSDRNSYKLVFSGAVFFIISDSLLSLNKFYEPLAFSNISIMLTYALAQYLIVLGILKQKG